MDNLKKQCNITYFRILIAVDSVLHQYCIDNIFLLGNCSNNLMNSYNIVDITCEIKGIRREFNKGYFSFNL